MEIISVAAISHQPSAISSTVRTLLVAYRSIPSGSSRWLMADG
jgi:hypothetical protein